MPRYIDADELEKAVEKYFSGLPIQGRYDILEIIAKTPTADVVEVVRCKECIWWDKSEDSPFGFCNVPYWVCKNWDDGTGADDFCHKAERRER